MWGSNCDQYLREAYRVLETNGSLIMLDTTKRWSETNEQNYIEESMMGVKLKQLLEATGFKIVGEKMDKFCYFRCVK
jgi:ubiquinone/menaquinone biosynthesis C-methylase UbiE